MSIVIRQAQADDASSLAEVIALLHQVELPDDGVAQHFSRFLLAHDGGKLAGCVGLEIYGAQALLRSLAVGPEWQHEGLGKLLTEQALDLARGEGVQEVVLLTTTAAEFFQRHFGFAPTERSAYDEVFATSVEWHLPRCASAVCLKLNLERTD